MNFLVVGLNHKTAPIAIRERFYLNPLQQDLLLSELRNNPAIIEVFVLSTCNRTEVFVHRLDNSITSEKIIQIICVLNKVFYNSGFMNHFYSYEDIRAVEHLFRVTAGLDSLVLGEKQILGQVKKAFESSISKGLFSKHFNILSNVAIRVGKKAQSETKISLGGSSVSWAAIVKAQEELGALADKSVLLIGAGEMSKLALMQICKNGFKNLYIMNRTIEHAKMLAQNIDAEIVPFCDIKETLSKVDLCICSSSSPHLILDAETMKRTMLLRGPRKLLLIDISMPRNIDPKIKDIENISLYHIDDLESVVIKNFKNRQEAVTEVETIIQSKLKDFQSKISKIKHLEFADSNKN